MGFGPGEILHRYLQYGTTLAGLKQGGVSMFEQQKVAKGLQILLSETRKQADSFPPKLHAMQAIYCERSGNLYTTEELSQLQYYLRAVIYKFHLATLSLEQLWSLSHTKRDELLEALENSLDRLECSDDELLLMSFALEGFLLQGKAFLDFYMLYLCLFLRTGHAGSISRSKFNKAMEGVGENGFAEKVKLVKDYFDTRVFGEFDRRFALSPDNWGTLLTSLRDKIAHRDRLRPSFDSEETLVDKVLFDWPTIQGITYDRFCQYMQNGMFSLFEDVSPIICDLEWKPGRYHPGLWSS
jgi:hypothetical protein